MLTEFQSFFYPSVIYYDCHKTNLLTQYVKSFHSLPKIKDGSLPPNENTVTLFSISFPILLSAEHVKPVIFAF